MWICTEVREDTGSCIGHTDMYTPTKYFLKQRKYTIPGINLKYCTALVGGSLTYYVVVVVVVDSHAQRIVLATEETTRRTQQVSHSRPLVPLETLLPL